jgi:hypothetical protein
MWRLDRYFGHWIAEGVHGFAPMSRRRLDHDFMGVTSLVVEGSRRQVQLLV